jgi:hypothetical protein
VRATIGENFWGLLWHKLSYKPRLPNFLPQQTQWFYIAIKEVLIPMATLGYVLFPKNSAKQI